MSLCKADFYVGMGPGAEWIGSVERCGEIWTLSRDILIQVSRMMYEESVLDYIRLCGGIVGDHICKWPWDWDDSRMTEYSYIFIPKRNKVYMSVMGDMLVDPIQILQGEDMITANAMLGYPDFPIMIDQVSFAEAEQYGYTLM